MPKTATKDFKVFDFDELSEEAKEKAIEEYRDINVDYQWYELEADGVADEWKEKYGITFKPDSLCFDLDRGHYLYFHGKNSIWVEDKAKLAMAVYGKGYNLVADKGLLEFRFVTHYQGGGYGYTTLDVDDYRSSETKDLPADCGEWFKDLVNDFWKMLYNQYYYLISDEAIIESIRANEDKFYEDGTTERKIYANAV